MRYFEDVSIEAARAGDAGEGVEQIADEVVELAAANEAQTEQVAEISRSVEALERSLDSAVGDE